MSKFAKCVGFTILVLSSSLYASSISISAAENSPSFAWEEAQFINAGSGNCELVTAVDWQLPAIDATKGSAFTMVGSADVDPTFTQTITNNSSQTWKDWHVDILNGTILSATVYKVGATPVWNQMLHIYNTGYSDGFGAGYGGNDGLTVGTGEQLFVQFVWVRNGSGTTQISQYPTYDGNFIPEPATLFFLLTALLGTILRTRK